MKRSVTAAAMLLALASHASLAADYYVVVPLKGRTASAAAIQVSLSNTSLPEGLQGLPYTYDFKQNLQVTGDPAYQGYGVVFTVTDGALPAGLSLNSNTGVVSGTPTVSGTSSFGVMASYKTKAGQADYQVVISANVHISLASATLPTATVGAAYAYNLASALAIDGDSAYTGSGVTWAITAGALPDGLSLSNTGMVSGVPTSEDSGHFTVAATYKTKSGVQTYQVNIAPIQVALKAATLGTGTVGIAYTYDFKPLVTVSNDATYAGAGAGVAWTLASGALPAGVTLNPNGTLSGTPSAVGTSEFTLQAGYKTKSDAHAYSLTVSATTIALQAGGYRTWSNNTMATSCAGYRTPAAGYLYSGDTGSGVYRIQPAGQAATDVYCDMTNDGGGWTLIVHGGAPGAMTGANWFVSASVNPSGITVPTANAPASKLSDAFIAAMPRTTGYRFDIYAGTGASTTRFVNSGCLYQHVQAIVAGSACNFSYGTLAQAQAATATGRYGGGGKTWHFGFGDDSNASGNSIYLITEHRYTAQDNNLWYTGNGNVSALTNAAQGGRYRFWLK